MDTGLINALMAGGGFAIIGTIINAIVSRRKLGADATKIITDAAANVTATTRQDNADLRAEGKAARTRERALEERLEDLEDAQRAWQRERREWRQILQVHAAWDFEAITALRAATPPVELRPAPPLTPENTPPKETP